MKTIFIKPAPGRLIRDPDTMRPLAQEEEKPSRRSGVGVLMTAMSFSTEACRKVKLPP